MTSSSNAPRRPASRPTNRVIKSHGNPSVCRISALAFPRLFVTRTAASRRAARSLTPELLLFCKDPTCEI
jgi:hypothetical protein